MNLFSRISLFLLRLSTGWLFLYAGISKITDPKWSAYGYMKGAKSFVWFYEFLMKPELLPIVNFLNKWGLTLIGISLIIGIFVRLSSSIGAFLMLLYYFVVLSFPYAGAHYYIVDDHIIFMFGLIVLAAMNAGQVWGLDKVLFARFKKLL